MTCMKDMIEQYLPADAVPVNRTGLNGGDQLQQEERVLEGGVFEALHLGALACALHGLVGPGDDVVVGDVGDVLLDSQLLQHLDGVPTVMMMMMVIIRKKEVVRKG
jgi:hypothetical protein